MTDRERIDSLVKKTSDYADEIMELNQENNELKKRVPELENASKPKRKFRAMTNSEFCIKYAGEENFSCLNCSLYRNSSSCVLADADDWKLTAQKPYKTKDGKYIMIEVKE